MSPGSVGGSRIAPAALDAPTTLFERLLAMLGELVSGITGGSATGAAAGSALSASTGLGAASAAEGIGFGDSGTTGR